MEFEKIENEEELTELITEITRVSKNIEYAKNCLSQEFLDRNGNPTTVRLNPEYFDKLRENMNSDKVYLNELLDKLEAKTQVNSFDAAKAIIAKAKSFLNKKFECYQKHIGEIYYLCVSEKDTARNNQEQIENGREIIIDANTKPITKYNSRSFLLREKELKVGDKTVLAELTTFIPDSLELLLESFEKSSMKHDMINIKRLEL